MNSKSKFMLGAYRLLFIGGILGCYVILTGRSYPIKQVTLPKHECKIEHRSKLGEDCKQDLPRIYNADYNSYSSNFKYTSIYSDIWGGSYDNGRDTSFGSSPGIDIATTFGTPVYAIAGGEVISASYAAGVGNSITIKHRRRDRYIYSSYSHLSVMNVTKGDTVQEGQLIGEVGKTGTTFGTYGNHLDFQITTTKQNFYPYSYHDCGEGTYYQIINQGLCRDKLAENTVDPIAFIESNGNINLPDKNDPKFARKTFDINTNSVGEVKQFAVSNVVKDTSTQSAIPTIASKGYDYKIVGLMQRDIAEIGRQFKFYVVINNEDGLPAQGKLPEQIKITESNGTLDFDQDSFGMVENGTIKVGVTGKKSGSSIIKITIGKQVIGSYMVEVIDSNLAMSDTRSKNAWGAIAIPSKTTSATKTSTQQVKLAKIDVGVAKKVANIKTMNSGLAKSNTKTPVRVLAKVNTTSNKSATRITSKVKSSTSLSTTKTTKQLSATQTKNPKLLAKTTAKKPVAKKTVTSTKQLAKTTAKKTVKPLAKTTTKTTKKLSYNAIDSKTKLLAQR